MSFENPTPVHPVTPAPTTSDKALMVLSHLAVFLGVPLLLPFVVWLVKRGEPAGVAAHAAEALNFHLSFLLYSLCCIPLILLFGLGGVLLFIIGIATVVLAIVAAVRAADNVLFRYPLTIRLVKA